jgi:hypothetical protein
MTTPSETVYATITLTHGQYSTVHVSHIEELKVFSWFAHWSKSTKSFYAHRTATFQDGSRHTISMHRQLLGLGFGDPRKGDHINGDTLCNVLTDDPITNNLRIATTQQNNRNRVQKSEMTSRQTTIESSRHEHFRSWTLFALRGEVFVQ